MLYLLIFCNLRMLNLRERFTFRSRFSDRDYNIAEFHAICGALAGQRVDIILNGRIVKKTSQCSALRDNAALKRNDSKMA